MNSPTKTTYKLTLLLAMLSTTPLVFTFFNWSNRSITSENQLRLVVCEQLTTSCAFHLRDKDYWSIGRLIDQFVNRTDGVGSVRLVRFDGLVIHQVGNHDLYWGFNDSVDPTQFRIPVIRDGSEWGAMEISFLDSVSNQQMWLLINAIAFTLSVNGLLFAFLLRRSLTQESGTMPTRVKNTLDTIAGGVVIVDDECKIVMANAAFQQYTGFDIDELRDTDLSRFEFHAEDNPLPWETALSSLERVSGETVFLDEGDSKHCFVVNATPIFGQDDKLAGTLISFEDITVLEEQKQSLVTTLAELESSKDQIHQQNLRLQELASMDALTKTFNRRYLFEKLEACWSDFESREISINCIMLDVDHFKSLNDNHGHAVGDQVLRDVSATIKSAVQEPAFVGRYGGEEFCVVMPNATLEEAGLMAEQIRYSIETHLAEPYAVTASFGVSSGNLGASTCQAMLEQADQALYAAKHGGRNAVRVWSEELLEAAEQDEVAVPTPVVLDQPISYHAVTSLHTALAYRDADTALHSQRVAEMSVALGKGLLSVSELYILEIAALLHDIGKIGVPDAVLLKPARLSVDEWKVMEAHAQMGVEIVDSSFNSKYLSDIVRYHHNRFDGAAGMDGLSGEDIPLGARIVCITDAFDAMVSNRVYRDGRSPEEAFEELRRCAGSQFDPFLVDRFVNMQIGWRADSRYQASDLDEKLALSIGHLTERTMSAFECCDRKILSDSLIKLMNISQSNDLPAIAHLASQLHSAVDTLRTDDEVATTMPILQDLLDVCLSVQRAHIRDVAARPEATDHCPQGEFYKLARSWDQDVEQD